MTKAFKKGEIAIHICCWDGEATFAFERVIVEACGTKKMALRDAATGKMLGANFYPGLGFGSHSASVAIGGDDRPAHCVVRRGTFKDMPDAEAEAMCLELAASFRAYEIKRLTGILDKHAEQYGEGAYFRAMCKKLARLKTLSPAAFKL